MKKIIFALCLLGFLFVNFSRSVNAEVLTQQIESTPASASTSTSSPSKVEVESVKPQFAKHPIPFRANSNDDVGTVANLAGAMIIVLIVFALVVAFLKKQKQFSNKWLRISPNKSSAEISTSLQVQKQIMLTPKNSLHVVMWGEVELLIACSDHESTLIARRHKAESAASPSNESTVSQ